MRAPSDTTHEPDSSLGDRSALLDGSLRASEDDSLLRELAGAPPRTPASVHLLGPGAIVAGKYRIEEKIGTGGMGAVFRATDLRLQRPVAIKVHHGRATSLERLRREARLLARLSHPNVVAVMEVGSHEGAPFVAMEYVAGGSARAWAREPGRTWREVVAVYVQAARGLAAAHEIGIVHRDFKPDNLLVGLDGRAHVADFGLADEDLASAQDLPLARTLESMGVDTGSGSEATEVTAAGSLVGTPAYVAPEQIRTSRVDARADQFSFCAALYEALYGELPFPGGSAVEVLGRILEGDLAEPSSRNGVPRWLHAVVVRGLSRAPERRFADMDALREALAGPRSRRVAGVVGTAALVVGIAFATNTEVEPDPRCEIDASVGWTSQREAVAATVPEGTSARDAWRQLDRRLDERGQAWSATWVTACAGNREDATPLERETMMRRLECLDEERLLTDALFETLAASDAAVIAHLLASASSWGDPLACLTEQAGATTVAGVTQPDEVDTVRVLLHRSKAAANAGQLSDALALAEEAVVEAQRGSDDASIARALLARGILQHAVGRRATAIEDVQAALVLGERVGEEAVQREGAVAMVMATNPDDYDTMMEWVTRARRHLHRWPDDARDQVRLLVLEASARGDRGELEQAQTLLDEAESSAQQADLPGDEVAAIWLERAALAAGRGDYGNAISHAERGRDLFVEELGADHFRVGHAFSMIAFIYDSAGNVSEALANFRRALAAFEAPGGGTDRRQLHMLVQIATLETLAGESERALADLDRALILATAIGIDDPAMFTNIREARGLALQDLGRLEEAYETFLLVSRDREAEWGSAHPRLRSGLLNVALAARSTGRHDEALDALDRARRIQTDLEANDVIGSDVYHSYGFALLDAGRDEEAAEQFELADKLLQVAFGDDHPDHGWPALGLARVELTRGNPKRALEWVQRGETAWQGDEADPQSKAELALTKANTLLALGRNDEALAVARAALALRPEHVGLLAWLDARATRKR